jgi:5-methylthioribose kinase
MCELRCQAVTSNIDAVSYIKATKVFKLKDPDLLHASELTEGHINYLFLVQTPPDNVIGAGHNNVVLKYCPPYVKSLGAEVFPLRQVMCKRSIIQ